MRNFPPDGRKPLLCMGFTPRMNPMTPQNTNPLPVGVAAVAAPAGWEWIIATEDTELRGLFGGPKAHLANYLRGRFAEVSAGRMVVPVFVGFDATTASEAQEREYRARMDAGPEVVKESIRFARQAQVRLHFEHPARLPKHSDRPETPPFEFDSARFGQIACDASVHGATGHGAWAVTSDAGWYQCGLIEADPGYLTSDTAELIGLYRAVSFARSVPGEVQVFNDNRQAVKAVHLLEGGATQQEVYARWPSLLQTPVGGLYDMFALHRSPYVMNVVWWPRNITPAMEWADRLAVATSKGEMEPTVPTLDLRGARPPFRMDLPKLVVEFIDQAEAAGWEVVGADVNPARGSSRLSRTVKVERGGVQMVGVWEKRKKQWVPLVVYRHEVGRPQALGWAQAVAELA